MQPGFWSTVIARPVPLIGALGLALATGCPAPEQTDGDGGSMPDSGTSNDDDADTGATSMMTVGASGSSGGDTTGPSIFILEPDGGGPNNQCDIWAQDCPMGEKCMPWADDGGGSWNATRCTEVSDNPGQPGDACTVEGSGVSGIDDCDLAAMCWDVDGETNTGLCVGFCEGSEDAPLCSNPDEGCSISNEGVLILCLAFCDPLLQDCSEGSACYPEVNGFFCTPDASGPDQGEIGDACGFINACDAGGWCAAAELVPGCTMSGSCCAGFCDLAEPMPSADCAAGTECIAYHEEGTAPPGEEDYGVCIIPQM